MADPNGYTADQILRSIKAAGYVTFEGPAVYDLNIFGIRSDNPIANSFDDIVGVVYRCADGEMHLEAWQATTDPGTYWLEGYNSSRVSGTAILVPGQYRGVYKLDLHGGKYEALCQRAGAVKVYRDSNRDNVLDWEGAEREGYYGINIHRASANHTSTQVNKWSAGCQVIANPNNFARLIELAHKQIEHHPTWTKFTYTLLTEDQIIP